VIGKLLLTHGGLAAELYAAAQQISAGKLMGCEALSLAWDESPEAAGARVGEALARLDQGEGVLILTDIHGGTPTNVAMSFCQPGKVEVLTGVNLPMVVRLACQAGEPGGLLELARRLRDKVRASICLGSDMVPARQAESPPAPAIIEAER
jgi:PTS system mannose-specific IIA component